MADSGFDQMRMEAGDAQNQIPPLDNVHEVQPPPPQFAEPMISDATSLQPYPAPLPQPSIPTTTTPAPRTATPSRPVNGTVEPTAPMPAKAASHGAPARRYLNEKVTGVLLEGMKRLAAEQPEMPLKILGEFLLQKSAELENRTT